MKIIKSFLLVFVLLLNCQILHAQFLKKLQQKIANLATSKTKTLNETVITAKYLGNLYPKTLKIQTGDDLLLSDIWEEGANIISVSIFGAKKIQAYEIEGFVKIDGEPMPYLGGGLYAKKFKDNNPKKISIETSTGEKAEFTVKPTLPVTIAEPENVVVDTKKDLKVRLQNPPGHQNTEVRIALYSKPTLTQHGWHTVNNFRSADEINIPAFAFASNQDGKFDYVKGSSYLLAERFVHDIQDHPTGAQVQTISSYFDYASINADVQKWEWGGNNREKDGVFLRDGFVQVTKNPGKEKEIPYQMGYRIAKSNAFDAIPFSKAKKFAVISFNVSGTALTQEQTRDFTTQTVQEWWNPNATRAGDITYQKTVITKQQQETMRQQFPQLPKLLWDNIARGIYTDIEKSFKQQHNITLIPVENVLQSQVYQTLPEMPDALSEQGYSSSYKGLKNINGPGFFKEILGFGYRIKKLIRELNVDGVIIMDLNLTMPWGEMTLTPKLTYTIWGAPNGYSYNPTMYAAGEIWGAGRDLKDLQVGKEGKNVTYSADVLDKVVRKESIIPAFTEAIKRMKEQEEILGYDRIWSLK